MTSFISHYHICTQVGTMQKGQTALDRASDKGVIVIVQELLKFTPMSTPKTRYECTMMSSLLQAL